MSITFQNDSFHLCAGGISYCIGVRDGQLIHLYWGREIPDADLWYLLPMSTASFEGGIATQYDFPPTDTGDYRTPMIEVEFSDGSRTTGFTYEGYEILPGKPSLPGLPATYVESEDEAETLIVHMKDAFTGLCADLQYTIFSKHGAITRSVRLTNGGETEMTIRRVFSASVDFPDCGYEYFHLHGAWARERQMERRPLLHGLQQVSSSRGSSSHQHNPFFALVTPDTTEEHGTVYSMNLVYSGSFAANAEVDCFSRTRMQIGINPEGFSWLLLPGETFQSPEAVMVFSDTGLRGMSQTYHTLYRNRLCRGKYRDAVRPILLNNWEATYFNFNEEKLLAIAKRAKEVGVELFVLDDGWFGKRDSDNCSLGDWVVDKRKLPNGLAGLVKKITDMGLKFGLWFEPEMISPDSDLYRAHPDWCLHVEGRPRTQQRSQLILDLSRQDVCDYIVEAVSGVLRSADISYVKWDMNRNMTEIGSALLPAERQRETAHRYLLGLYDVMERITSAFPDVLFEGCSGGGGRFDPGMLYYMPQIWCSDDTDAIERVCIQYGTSMAYPISAMGAHVSAVPNHQTGRIAPLKTRGDVALSGNFGYELDLNTLTDEEIEMVKQQVALCKEIRHITMFGDYYRLINPFEGNYGAWQFVAPDGSEVIVCAVKRLSKPNHRSRPIKLAGLEPEAQYEIAGTGKQYAGAVLMQVGLLLKESMGDFESFLVRLKRV